MIKNILIGLTLILIIISCSKSEDEIPLADPGVSSSQFDSGYLGILLQGANTMVDSIVYTNITKGSSFNIPPSQVIFNQGDTVGYFFKPLRSGNDGDDVNCCVYINTPTLMEVVFSDSVIVGTADTVIYDSVGIGTHYFPGIY